MRLALILVLAGLAAPVFADPILSRIEADLTRDGHSDEALLIKGSDADAHLLINASDGSYLFAGGIVFAGGIGQEPRLELAPNGSLKLVSLNDSIGRNRWEQTLTIAYRGGGFLVAGYTYRRYDTLSLESGLCDANLLTGGTDIAKNDSRSRVDASPEVAPLAGWSMGRTPLACGES